MTNPTNEREAERAAVVAAIRTKLTWRELADFCGWHPLRWLAFPFLALANHIAEYALSKMADAIERGDHIPQNQSLDHLQPTKGE